MLAHGAAGRWLGGRPNYGYLLIDTDTPHPPRNKAAARVKLRVLEPDDADTAPVVRRIFELFDHLWHRVNARITNTRGPQRRRPRAEPSEYLLAGILRCAACGRWVEVLGEVVEGFQSRMLLTARPEPCAQCRSAPTPRRPALFERPSAPVTPLSNRTMRSGVVYHSHVTARGARSWISISDVGVFGCHGDSAVLTLGVGHLCQILDEAVRVFQSAEITPRYAVLAWATFSWPCANAG